MLDSLVVDSVMTVFNQGVKAGLLTYVTPVSGVVAVLTVIILIKQSTKG